MKKIVIAIDGFSGCGKSTTAKTVASRLGYAYIDSGAMYRAVTLYFIKNFVNPTDPKAIEKALENILVEFHFNPKSNKNETYLNGLNVEEEIRKMYISEKVSEISAIPAVRHAMVALQRKMGKKKGVVMDGRDIGTNVFPDAELKVFMTANMQVRAERRQRELLEKNQLIGLPDILDNLQKRDHMDSNRAENPLRQADDAHVIDTSYMTFEEQVEEILRLSTTRMIDEA